MKKYDEYKDSGVAWIGEVPKHWEVGKLKHCSHIVLGKMLMTSPPRGSEGSYTLEKYLKSKNVGWLQLFLEEDNIDEMWFNQYEKSIYKLQENDIVMNEGGDIGKVSCWRGTDFDCYIQNSINKITADYNRVDAGFLCYWLYNLSSLGYFWSIVSQISIAHLTKEKLSNSPVVLPPITEQVAIATYLDTHCAKIDNLISIQQKRIALLQELKQSVITHAVTKGLNPNVEMKQSGVEWIGDVPKHWEVSKIKYLISHSSAGVWGEDEKNDENDIVCFRAADFDYIHGCLRLDKMAIRNIQPEQLRGRTLQHGDLLIEKSGGGDNAPVGRIVRYNYNDKATCSNFMHFIRVNKFNDGNYLFYYFYAMYANNVNILFFNQTTGIQNLKIGEYIGQMIYTPILEEQAAIASYLDHKCATIDTSISNAQHQIELLQEYKQSLITEVVTGKYKVC